jgi:hypothetical protein
MFRTNQIVGRQTKSEPEAATNFPPGDRQRSETGSRLNALRFDGVIQIFSWSLEYVPLLDFPSDISRNRSIASPSFVNRRHHSKYHGFFIFINQHHFSKG